MHLLSHRFSLHRTVSPRVEQIMKHAKVLLLSSSLYTKVARYRWTMEACECVRCTCPRALRKAVLLAYLLPYALFYTPDKYLFGKLSIKLCIRVRSMIMWVIGKMRSSSYFCTMKVNLEWMAYKGAVVICQQSMHPHDRRLMLTALLRKINEICLIKIVK